MHQHHVAGDKAFVDYSGKRIGICDPNTGVLHLAEIFVAVMGGSSLSFAYDVADIKSEQAAGFISVHVAGFTLECLAGPVGIRTAMFLEVDLPGRRMLSEATGARTGQPAARWNRSAVSGEGDLPRPERASRPFSGDRVAHPTVALAPHFRQRRFHVAV